MKSFYTVYFNLGFDIELPDEEVNQIRTDETLNFFDKGGKYVDLILQHNPKLKEVLKSSSNGEISSVFKIDDKDSPIYP